MAASGRAHGSPHRRGIAIAAIFARVAVRERNSRSVPATTDVDPLTNWEAAVAADSSSPQSRDREAFRGWDAKRHICRA